jgi:hypothetical protein
MKRQWRFFKGADALRIGHLIVCTCVKETTFCLT